jgi:hypothetical protein
VVVDSDPIPCARDAFSRCVGFLTSDISSLKPFRGVHALIQLARSQDLVPWLTPDIVADIARGIEQTADPGYFDLLKLITDPARLEGYDVGTLFSDVLEAILSFIISPEPESEPDPTWPLAWWNDITTTKNALIVLTQLVLAHPDFFTRIAEEGVDQTIIEMSLSSDKCMTESYFDNEVRPIACQADCFQRYNENHYKIASIAGALAFYEAVTLFRIPDEMETAFDAALSFDSRYLVNYALKVIERLTRTRPELCRTFSKPLFLDHFFRLWGTERCSIDLWFILDVDRMTATNLQAKRRFTHIGYHALGILANICYLHDPELTKALLAHNVLDYNLDADHYDQDIVYQFFSICKHVLLTLDCRATCLDHECMRIIMADWGNWPAESQQCLNLAMARIFTTSTEPSVAALFRENRDFLEIFLDNIQSVTKERHREELAGALLKLISEGDIPIGPRALLLEQREGLLDLQADGQMFIQLCERLVALAE